MYPSKSNANAEAAFDDDSETSKLAARSLASGEKPGPPTDPRHQSSQPSAPLLPYSDPSAPDMEPPSYSSVVAQDSTDWRNRSSSFSGGRNTTQLHPPASPHVSGAKSSSDLDRRAPYPIGPTNHASSHGSLVHAHYPTGPGSSPQFPSKAPYPTGPGFGSGVTSEQPYPQNSGHTSGPANQAPYSVGSTPMPMPGPANGNRPIGFAVPITTEPKSESSLDVSGNRQGENRQYVPNQYVQQQPNVVYVIQKAPQQRNRQSDDCETCACCVACCLCICECINLCHSSDS